MTSRGRMPPDLWAQSRPAADFDALPLAPTAFLHNLGVDMVIVGLTLCAFPAHLRQRRGSE